MTNGPILLYIVCCSLLFLFLRTFSVPSPIFPKESNAIPSNPLRLFTSLHAKKQQTLRKQLSAKNKIKTTENFSVALFITI